MATFTPGMTKAFLRIEELRGKEVPPGMGGCGFITPAEPEIIVLLL
jgi:hypothetical protein